MKRDVRTDESTRAGQMQPLDEEVVVDGVPARIVAKVVQCDLPFGTLPMTRAKERSGARMSAKLSTRICACG